MRKWKEGVAVLKQVSFGALEESITYTHPI